ncbi:MAG: Re/Si-specific NAD(P)(+) transhydrogenase subunit alpha [Alphaproteobacteria bacterium]|nr:Re/Si-specific NAD(P)(+) transhydrogenase subunit alpha [Alphaproteobacteria bacterium]
MKIAVLKERAPHESRVAVSPDTVKKLIDKGAEICIELGAGKGASIPDAAYKGAGATICKTAETTLNGAGVVLAVQGPETALLDCMNKDTVLIAMLNPLTDKEYLKELAKRNITSFAMELMPRISRAQSMDVLSSQSNLAGYRAVIDAVASFTKATPMMMTAAGTVAPAKVLVLGAGVAGLQAIATAKRLGAVVSAFDVRPAVKEQVQSLGAKFVEVPAEESGEAAGGYAKEMSEEYKQKQSQLISDTLAKTDIAITTALIPGKPAPILITEEMLSRMKSGSIVVDLAVTAGGNCPFSEADKEVVKHGVKILSYTNVPSRVAVDASQLYAKNLLNFIAPFIAEGALAFDWEDELVAGTLVTKDGKVTLKS